MSFRSAVLCRLPLTGGVLTSIAVMLPQVLFVIFAISGLFFLHRAILYVQLPIVHWVGRQIDRIIFVMTDFHLKKVTVHGDHILIAPINWYPRLNPNPTLYCLNLLLPAWGLLL